MNAINLPTWTLLNTGYSLVNNTWAYNNVCSRFTRLYYITEGEGELILSDGIVKLTPGNMYIIPALTRHSTRCQNNMAHYYVHIHENNTEELLPTYVMWTLPTSIVATENDLNIFKQLSLSNPNKTLLNENPARYDTSEYYRIQLERELYQPITLRLLNNSLISMLMSRWFLLGKYHHNSKIDRIEQAALLIRSNLNTNINIDNLAKEAKMSRHHFCRLFKAKTGLSVGNYIRQARIFSAQVLLSHTHMAIKEIALQVGYEDYNYFIRVFHQVTGTTPSQFRQSMR